MANIQNRHDCTMQYAEFNKSDPFAYNRAMSHMRSLVGREFYRVIKNDQLVDAFPLINQFCYGADKHTSSNDAEKPTTIFTNVRVP